LISIQTEIADDLIRPGTIDDRRVNRGGEQAA
jgi:hypothetical protein